jgi:hypothetical protein
MVVMVDTVVTDMEVMVTPCQFQAKVCPDKCPTKSTILAALSAVDQAGIHIRTRLAANAYARNAMVLAGNQVRTSHARK